MIRRSGWKASATTTIASSEIQKPWVRPCTDRLAPTTSVV